MFVLSYAGFYTVQKKGSNEWGNDGGTGERVEACWGWMMEHGFSNLMLEISKEMISQEKECSGADPQ